jgi:diadenylate cyclase
MWQNVNNVLAQLRILDFLDIFIVYFVFYRLIVLIKDTRAVQLIKGLVVLLAATVVSERLGLYTLNWLFSRTITAGLFAIPILFWPELRRALEHLGRARLFGKRFHLAPDGVDSDTLAHAVAQTAGVLSKSRTGALMVLERDTGLTEYTETGIPMDAVVTTALLNNIFVPNTPLHDGAVIIRAGRLAAAGCYLPLSTKPDISKELGTRHRAALGISEETDALVVVVSEETGAISLCESGKITRHMDVKTLQAELASRLKSEQLGSLLHWSGRE